MLDQLTKEQWSEYLEQTFQLRLAGGASLPLQLVEVNALGAAWAGAKREPYALLFHGPCQPVLPQGIMEISHPRLGNVALFLVPIGPDRQGMRYEAIFT